jgi:hypothetical protein
MPMNVLANMMRTPGDPKIRRSGPSSFSASDRLARNLGWVSIALGLTELTASRKLARALGMQGQEGLISGFGAREIASGMLCLSVNKKAGLISRVAGDGLDMAVLASALDRRNPKRDNVALAMAAVLGIMTLDVIAAKLSTARHRRGASGSVDYSDRSGFPGGVGMARGRARQDFKTPPQMREQPALA